MKQSFLLILLLSSFAVMAQETPALDSTVSKSFIGASVSSASFSVMGKPKYESIGNIVPIANLYYGYRLSKRATIQLGFGYGANTLNSASLRYVNQDTIYTVVKSQEVRGVILPLTLKFTPFNPYRRLQVYINASLTPVIGHIKARATEELEGYTKTLYDEEISTFDLIATGGFTVNYKLNERLDLYADAIFLYKNLNYEKPFRNHYEGKSVGVGLNYNLNWQK